MNVTAGAFITTSLCLYSLHLFEFVNLSLAAISLVRRLEFRKGLKKTDKKKTAAVIGWPENLVFDAEMTDAGAGHVNWDKE